jgi:DNA-binding NarL/FixJ family response regulator
MRIVIADDHGIVREGLRTLLGKQPDVKVVAEGEDGQIAVQLVKEFHPDIVIIDMSMPNLNGIDATRHILKHSPGTRIIMLSMHSDKHIVKEALEAGVSAYVLKTYLFDEMLRALEIVGDGGRYLSPRITDIVIDDFVDKATEGKSVNKTKLTGRERQIVQLVAEGKSVKEIARILHISPKTADTNRRQIMNKLNIPSVAELTKYAIREGLTSLEF